MRLGDLVAIRKGRKPEVVSSIWVDGYQRLIQIDDLRANAELKFCPAAQGEVLALPSDAIIAWDGANAGTTGVGLAGALGSTLARLRPLKTELDSRYLGHFLKANQGVLRVGCKGATVPHIDGAQLAALNVPLPPLPEQRRIADILDRAETLRAQRRQALAQLDALAEAIFLDMFECPASEQWPRVPIRELSESMRTGPFGSQLLHSEFVNSGIAVLGIDNVVQNRFVWARQRFISESKFRQLSRYRVAPEDVLVTIMGTCGRCAIAPVEMPVAINTKHLCCVTLNRARCLPQYLQACFLLHPEVLYRLGIHERGAVMPGLNMGIIGDLEIPLPPMAAQERFKRNMDAVHVQTNAMEGSARELDALFASLQHRAFRGEL